MGLPSGTGRPRDWNGVGVPQRLHEVPLTGLNAGRPGPGRGEAPRDHRWARNTARRAPTGGNRNDAAQPSPLLDAILPVRGRGIRRLHSRYERRTGDFQTFASIAAT